MNWTEYQKPQMQLVNGQGTSSKVKLEQIKEATIELPAHIGPNPTHLVY